MAIGWASDGAAQDQIDASVEDGVRQARSNITTGESSKFCEECDARIPELRRKAIPGVHLCVACQSCFEEKTVASSGINRRGSKDSQLR